MTLPSFLLKILFYLSMLKTIWDFASFTDILLLQRDISTLIIKSNKIRYRLSLPNYLLKKGYIINTNICVFRVGPKSSRQFQSRPKISDWILELDATIQIIKKIANCLINGLQYKKINKRIYNKINAFLNTFIII